MIIPSSETRAIPPTPAQKGLLEATLRLKTLKKSHQTQTKSPRKKAHLQIRRTTPTMLISLTGLPLHPMDIIHIMNIHPAAHLHTMVPPHSVQEAFPSMDDAEAITHAVAPINSADGVAAAAVDALAAVIGPPPPSAAGAAGTLT